MTLHSGFRSTLLVTALALGACASTPIETGEGVTLTEVTAAELAADAALERAPRDGTVLWGGVVLGVSNEADSSLIEVLAYPLDRVQRPQTGRTSEGRFVIVQPGYVESLDYAPGRQITVLGALDGTVDGRIGKAERRFPRVRADQLHLWRPGAASQPPRFTFGIGIGIDA